MEKDKLRRIIEEVLNNACAENESNTPAFILADYLMSCLTAYDKATRERDKWYAVMLSPAHSYFLKDEDPPDEES